MTIRLAASGTLSGERLRVRLQLVSKRGNRKSKVSPTRAIQTKEKDNASFISIVSSLCLVTPVRLASEGASSNGVSSGHEESDVSLMGRIQQWKLESVARGVRRRVLMELSSLPRSMGVMFGISVLSALGTIIEQDENIQFYITNYPDGDQKVLGFLTYKIILFLQLDHIYTAPYFYALIGLLVAQLIACTHTRQWPIAKAAKRWRFARTEKSIAIKDNAEVLPDANIRDLGVILSKRGYEIFLKDGSLYGFKSLVGRLAPIGVHIALLITIAGICWGVLGGFKGVAMIPEGREIVVQDYLHANSVLALPPFGAKQKLHVNDFTIDYRSDGSISQFFSDLSMMNTDGQEILRKRISVNDPLRFGGITAYQSDWGMAAIRATVESSAFPDGTTSALFPMAILENSKDSKLSGTFIPLPQASDGDIPKGVSVVASDFQTVVLYDDGGAFAGVRRPGSGKPIDVSGLRITIDEIIGSSGLELKYDPGVPLTYTGFAFLMITTILSYLSHSQIWALQRGRDVHVAGTSNRAGVLFKQELSEMLDAVPDAGIQN